MQNPSIYPADIAYNNPPVKIPVIGVAGNAEDEEPAISKVPVNILNFHAIVLIIKTKLSQLLQDHLLHYKLYALHHTELLHLLCNISK